MLDDFIATIFPLQKINITVLNASKLFYQFIVEKNIPQLIIII